MKAFTIDDTYIPKIKGTEFSTRDSSFIFFPSSHVVARGDEKRYAEYGI